MLIRKSNTDSVEEIYDLVLIKKGNKKHLNNFSPICELSNIYELLTKVLTKSLEKTLDENQPREQAGFRSRYSTRDHIHVVNQLKEKCREYNIPLCIAFVDYEKAFNSLQTQAVLTSLQEQAREDVYIELLNETDTISYKKKATISTSGEEYDWEIPYRRSCLRQHSKAYSDD